MENNIFEKVKQFQTIFKSHVGGNIPLLPEDENERKLRVELLREEYEEYVEAEKNNDIVEIADALGDIIYIAIGTAVSYGIPLEEIFNEIHDSNMSKLDSEGNPIFREDGKILKGENYFKPRIKEIMSKTKNEG